MRLGLLTNSVSPHQLPLAGKLVELLGPGNVLYVADGEMSPDRKSMGWSQGGDSDWVVDLRAQPQRRAEVYEQLASADILLSGNRAPALFARRVCAGRPTLYLSERWFKPPVGRGRLLSPAYLRMAMQVRRLSQAPHMHYLAIGEAAARDLRWLGAFGGRTWTWGYFVAPPLSAADGSRVAEGGCLSVLWVGRMLRLKQVDLLIHAVKAATQAGRKVTLRLVGAGPELERLRQLVIKYDTQSCVQFYPQLPNEKVREVMNLTDAFVFPSSGKEGWGAVINEAMEAGCAVVASRLAGASTTLIQDGVNGLLFNPGRCGELASLLLRLADDPAERLALGAAAQHTMRQLWSPGVAAERLLSMCDALLAGRRFEGYASGPLSKPAERLERSGR